ncbi:MAG: MFS transporter [Ilumatobacteraceae bacterium]
MSAETDDDAASLPIAGGLRSALTDRNFVPFLAGNVLSNCGTWFQNIAQTLLVYRLTGSVFLVGIVNLAQFAGVFLVAPWAGVVADRFDRRRLLLGTQIFSSFVAAGLAAVSAAGAATVPVVVAVALTLGVAQAFTVPAMLALVPQLVGPHNLAAAVSLNIVTFNVARAVGPVLGALVVATLGVSAAFAVNATSFLALAIGVFFVRPLDASAARSTEPPKLRRTVRDVLGRADLLWVYLAAACASVAIDPVTTLTPEYATKVFDGPDTLVGWFVGAFGVGAVLAGLWVSQRSMPSDRSLGARCALLACSMWAFAATTWLAVALAALVVAGFCFIALSAAGLARVQGTTEASSHGRLMALWSMAFMGARPIAALTDGFLASMIGVRWATLMIAAPAALVGGVMLVGRVARDPAPEAVVPLSPSS